MGSSWMKGRAFLFLEAGRRVYRCQFTKDLTLIGSDKSNDIVIRDDSVDSSHAQISRAGDVYTLRAIEGADLRVDNEVVESAYELMNGNRIEIGDTDILFAREQHTAPTTVHLVITKSGEPPMGFWTSKSTVVIGREKGDIIIDDPLLSKVHAIIENFCEGGQFLLDARSERGTGLNGESIEARHKLADGDVITLGGCEIEFRSNPFASEHGGDAAKLAEERIAALRKAGRPRLSSEIGEDGGGMAPRNPYQRYPSSLPDADPPTARGRRDPDDEADEPAPRRRRRGLDLRSGLQTGIVNVGEGPRRVSERRRRARAHGESVASASTPAAPRARRAPETSGAAPRRSPRQSPEDLPNLKPRPHWGDPAKKRGAGFGDRRAEMDTRLSRGNVDDSGLWYLPGGRAPDGRSREPLAKPIIRARGDKVPQEPDETYDRSMKDMRDVAPPGRRARIRRPAGPRGTGSSPVAPMKSAGSVERPPPRREPPEPRRRSEGAEAPRVPGADSPGARPDQRERWYIPEERRKPIRQAQHSREGAYYLPESRKRRRPSGEDYQDEYGDRHERPEPKEKQGSSTQVFNGDDY